MVVRLATFSVQYTHLDVSLCHMFLSQFYIQLSTNGYLFLLLLKKFLKECLRCPQNHHMKRRVKYTYDDDDGIKGGIHENLTNDFVNLHLTVIFGI